MRTFADIQNGRVTNTYVSMDNTSPSFGATWVEVPNTTNLPGLRGRSYDPDTGTFGSVIPGPRLITHGQFIDRFSLPLQLALERIASEPDSEVGRLVRVFTRRLEAESMVNLGSEVLEATLLQLKPALIADGNVPGFEDPAAAVATIAALLA